MRPLLRLVALATCLPAAALAQTGTVTGRVVDAATQQTLPGASVLVPGPDSTVAGRAVTDLDGQFSIGGLAPGTYAVRASFVGFEAAVQTDVVVQPSRPTFVLFELREAAASSGEAVVTAGLFVIEPDAPVSVQVLGSEEIRRTPGSRNDISRSILSLPGVTGGTDFRSDLLVRGGGPSENLYIVDGIEVPQINHFATQGAAGGAFGILNVDFIREAEFYTGGFPVRYGDAGSSVLVVENRPGSPQRLAGDFTVGAAESALSLDGAVGERFNWLLSGRRSYLQFLFQALGLPIRPAFWDFQTRLEYTPTSRDRIVGFGLVAIDDFDIVRPADDADVETVEVFDSVLDNDQRATTGGVSWRRLLRGGFATLAVSRSRQSFRFADLDRDGAELLANASVETATRARLDAELRLSPALTLGVGGGTVREAIRTNFFQRATPATTFPADLRFASDLGLWEGFGYAQLIARRGRVALTGGFRADVSGFLDQGVVPSPRLTATVDLTSRLKLSAAAGVFTQSPELVSLAVRDGSGDLVNRGLRWIRVRQAVGGLAFLPVPSLRLSAEAYVKGYGDYPVSASDPRVSLANLGSGFGFVGAEPLLATGRGRAYGVELFAQRKRTGRVNGLVSYSLSRSEFAGADGRYRPSAWDIRHALTLTGGLVVGGWEAGSKITVQSGRPYTPFDLAASAEEYAVSGRGVPDLGRLNTERTPLFARVDVRVDRRFRLPRGAGGIVYLDIQNVFNRKNVFELEYTEDPAVPGRLRESENVRLLPSVGFSVEF